jgi:hypothetical protein
MTIDGLRRATPQPILAGFLAFENGWTSDDADEYLKKALAKDQDDGQLNIGCIAAYGTFGCEGEDCQTSIEHDKAVTMFLLSLITKLQKIGTVPAIDMTAYAVWLRS